MITRIIKTFLIFITILITIPVYSQSFFFFLDNEYRKEKVITEALNPRRLNDSSFLMLGGGSRLIYESEHKQPSIGGGYTGSGFEITGRFTPKSYTQSARAQDLDFYCFQCNSHRPQIDWTSITIHDRMERSIVQNENIWSHSISDNVDVSYTAASFLASYFPYSASNTGLFLKTGYNQSFIEYKVHHSYNPVLLIRSPDSSSFFLPGINAVQNIQHESILTGVGYRGKPDEYFSIEGELGILGGRDKLQLRQPFRGNNLTSSGYGSGFYWSALISYRILQNFTIFLKPGQQHYFGYSYKIEGIYAGHTGAPG